MDVNAVEVGKLAVTAGGLLLNEPDAQLRDNLRHAGYPVGDEENLQQLFFDRLGIPQSGLYLPPYEHVFRKGKRVGDIWHFPPARHDGALGVEAVYRSWGFQRAEVPASPLFTGAHLPGDHLGFMLVFAGSALQGIATDWEKNRVFVTSIKAFIEEHLDEWVDAFCELLPADNKGGYLQALADAVVEAVGLLRAWCVRCERMTAPTAADGSRETRANVDRCR